MAKIAGKDGVAGRREVQLACFRLGEEFYALDIMKIREIIKPQKLTPVPKAPAFVEGVINLRGAVIPIVDLRRRFGLVVVSEEKKARIIICSVSGKIVGLLVDEVTEVRNFTRDEVQPAPRFMQGRDTDYILGVSRVRGSLVVILDLEKILSGDEILKIEKIQVDQ
ncbi:chemotaxis protein CheW [Geoalkalibacter halelectricus]|uniref:Chemotaxis protein CheW n=1 Tax=Geoalkalibacter halelectricus TaxID=2847045 RepID=A0ABY5ZMR7_9BACT|nr:chemotaxis protein CheW [Geoalkalibacter halelectricus]MDO3380047.1 chemotaxis protein CheW [Geoalkalibacter halelectricus]UWZ80430.1 chemotaxis protein CheW [Geoalkalibacter halelectricus]